MHIVRFPAGFENRLELHFSGNDPMVGMGLQHWISNCWSRCCMLCHELWCRCLFVYPTKIIIKTCGTTLLLKSIPPLLCHGPHMGLAVCGCGHTRGNFIFPTAQP
ncbi:hypothetical protein VitviT2T_026722 [Vitis vinifera]|uniref:Uncharacterized protein n=1 Tax=Vitis vinifera TaxID=29760 RepID=A0ABY9DQM0_VITVI|nr:hypothetical protein VitviT2T_026722 [Vitis vinifera]